MQGTCVRKKTVKKYLRTPPIRCSEYRQFYFFRFHDEAIIINKSTTEYGNLLGKLDNKTGVKRNWLYFGNENAEKNTADETSSQGTF